ncbi:hypothetical protein ACFYUK_20295 [Nonomuraea wenchangensis]
MISTVAAGVLLAWTPTGGHDLVDSLRKADPLRVLSVKESLDGDVALGRPIVHADDRAALLTQPESFSRLVTKYQGAPVGRLDLTIVAEGGRSRVRVVDIRPRVARRLPVLTGSYFRPTSAGEAGVISMKSDLDRPDSRFRLSGKSDRLYFSTKQIELARGEQVTLLLTFEAKKAFYEFDLVATLIADGREYQQVIERKSGGKFRVTGAAKDYRRYHQTYEGDGFSWSPMSRPVKCRIFPKSKGC